MENEIFTTIIQSFFTQLMDVREDNTEKISASERDSYFISMKIHHNLVVLTRCFVGYANK